MRCAVYCASFGVSCERPLLSVACRYKCFKLFTEGSTFENSILQCKGSKRGALDAQLVQIESYEERSAVLHMCRGERYVLSLSVLNFLDIVVLSPIVTGYRIRGGAG